MKKFRLSIDKKKLAYLVTFLILFYLLLVAARTLRTSLFFKERGRVNVVFYGEHPRLYSLGLRESSHYFLSFFPDFTVSVPGGYGTYRMGGLSKLAVLDRKPDIFKKTFSSAVSSFVDFYFYPGKNKENIYFGNVTADFNTPDILDIVTQNSNASFFDRVYLAHLFFGKGKNQFRMIGSPRPSDDFFEKYRGYFYDEVLREERKSVQIRYSSSYQTAKKLSNILEGEGIRVADIAEGERGRGCTVSENSKAYSETAKSISDFFGCRLRKTRAGIYDILLELGNKEEEWLIE